MKILVACEESQTVTKEFRKKGHEAWSCDIQECSGGHPEWHIKGDVLEQLDKDWDMIIAFPPCTYLSNAGARHLYPRGKLNKERYKKGLAAKEFFMKIWTNKCHKICIENPVSSKIFELPLCTQEIQPYQFGHPFSKLTRLWIKGLPIMKPTNAIPKHKTQNTKKIGNWFNKGGKDRQKNRSKTFSGIAKAMAQQWG